MFKFVTFAALVAIARVEGGFLASSPAISYGAPASLAYAPAYTEIHAPAIGSQSQSVVRSLDGNSAVSQYSKAVDTAFSSVRKYDTRVTNDAKFVSYSAAPLSYAAPAALQYAQYSAPAVVKTLAQPAVYAGPQYATYASAPAVVKTLAQPAVYAAPQYATYASAPAVVKTLAQPAVYAAPQYAHYAAAPAVVKTLAQPAVYAAPQYAQYAQYAAPAPIVKSPLIAHTSFTGLGTSYVY